MDYSIIDKIKAVRLQINNICNMSTEHPLCPSSRYLYVRQSMPGQLVAKIVNQLLCLGYAEEFGFHTYNDPLCDCRLLSFIELIRDECDNRIFIYTNGEYLTDALVEELKSLRVNILVTTYTGYSMAIAERHGLGRCMPGFDDRLSIYGREESGCKEPCGAPYSQLIVDVDGNVNLCCFDWASSVKFGNLNTELLHDVLTLDTMTATAGELSRGIRTRHDICRRCRTHR